jgi:hypothetical protein
MEENIPVLKEVKPLKNFCLQIKFSDGVEGIVDLSEFAGSGVFALWNDYSQFEKATIGSSGELVWNEDVDMDGLRFIRMNYPNCGNSPRKTNPYTALNRSSNRIIANHRP